MKSLERWTEEYGHLLPQKKDKTRGIHCTRRYGRWVKYNKGGWPKLTGYYTQDGDIAIKFFEASQYL